MDRVKSKTCIVTGAALGIGRACALELARLGAHVALPRSQLFAHELRAVVAPATWRSPHSPRKKWLRCTAPALPFRVLGRRRSFRICSGCRAFSSTLCRRGL